MPSFRIPVSLYVEADDIHAALQLAAQYLDAATEAAPLATTPGLVAVDLEAHQAESCPPLTTDA